MKRFVPVLAALALALAACGGDSTSDSTVAPVLDDYAAATFVTGIDNPYFPFTPGATWSYEGIEDGEVERIEVVVTSDTRLVDGVTTIVVRDTVTLDGELIEDTFDSVAGFNRRREDVHARERLLERSHQWRRVIDEIGLGQHNNRHCSNVARKGDEAHQLSFAQGPIGTEHHEYDIDVRPDHLRAEICVVALEDI